MAHIITFANPKGGTSKTTTVVNLACAIAATKRKVLVVDTDPQGSATVGLSVARKSEGNCLAGCLISHNSLYDLVVHYKLGGFDIIPSTDDLTAVQVALYNEEDKLTRLAIVLSEVEPYYDYIFIDTPPSLNILTQNALCASDFLIIPMPCEFFALDSLNSLVEMFDSLNVSDKAHVKLLGIVRVLYEEQSSLSVSINQELKRQFGDLLFNCIIPFSARLAECSSTGRPIMFYDKSSQGARSYLSLAGELLGKIKKEVGAQ